LPGRPDITFSNYRLAVFVHGCFWHRCPKCNIPIPRTNASYWKEKLKRNLDRDKRVFRQLEQAGWKVIRFWECEINQSVEKCVSQIHQPLEHTHTNLHISPK
jgi:DNA mismatch endonuclease (patch repair protein)